MCHPQLLLAAYGAPRRHSRACSGIQKKRVLFSDLFRHPRRLMLPRRSPSPRHPDKNDGVVINMVHITRLHFGVESKQMNMLLKKYRWCVSVK